MNAEDGNPHPLSDATHPYFELPGRNVEFHVLPCTDGYWTYVRKSPGTLPDTKNPCAPELDP